MISTPVSSLPLSACEFIEVNLEMEYFTRPDRKDSYFAPLLPRIGYMFVHFMVDISEKAHDVYEVPISIADCEYCAQSWRLFGRNWACHRAAVFEHTTTPKPVLYCRVTAYCSVVNEETDEVEHYSLTHTNPVPELKLRKSRMTELEKLYN